MWAKEHARTREQAENKRKGKYLTGKWHNFMPFGSFRTLPTWRKEDWKKEYGLIRKRRGDFPASDSSADADASDSSSDDVLP